MPFTGAENLRPMDKKTVPCCTTCHDLEWTVRRHCGMPGHCAKDCLIGKGLDDNPEELAKLDRDDPDYYAKAVLLGHGLVDPTRIAVPIQADVQQLFAPPMSHVGGQGPGGGAVGMQAAATGSGTSVRSGGAAKDEGAPELADAAAEGVAHPAPASPVGGTTGEGSDAPWATVPRKGRSKQQRGKAVGVDVPPGGGNAQGDGRGAAGPSGEATAGGTGGIEVAAEALPRRGRGRPKKAAGPPSEARGTGGGSELPPGAPPGGGRGRGRPPGKGQAAKQIKASVVPDGWLYESLSRTRKRGELGRSVCASYFFGEQGGLSCNACANKVVDGVTVTCGTDANAAQCLVLQDMNTANRAEVDRVFKGDPNGRFHASALRLGDDMVTRPSVPRIKAYLEIMPPEHPRRQAILAHLTPVERQQVEVLPGELPPAGKAGPSQGIGGAAAGAVPGVEAGAGEAGGGEGEGDPDMEGGDQAGGGEGDADPAGPAPGPYAAAPAPASARSPRAGGTGRKQAKKHIKSG